MELGELKAFVTVAAEHSFSRGVQPCAHVLLPALKFFLAKQPHVSIEFRRVPELYILGEVGAGAIDIGVTTRDQSP